VFNVEGEGSVRMLNLKERLKSYTTPALHLDPYLIRPRPVSSTSEGSVYD
jgi:hypothetical protein